MKKLLASVVLFLLFGCIGGAPSDATPSASASPNASPTSSFFGIDTAIAAGLPYKCTIVVDNVTTDVWVKGNNYKMISSTPEGLVESRKIGDYVYVHSPDGKWYKMKTTTMETNTAAPVSAPTLEDFPEGNIQCVPQVFGDDVISAPADAVDLDEMMKNLTGMLNNSMPTAIGSLDIDCDVYANVPDCSVLPGDMAADCLECKG